jgi:hypothetical protein
VISKSRDPETSLPLTACRISSTFMGFKNAPF